MMQCPRCKSLNQRATDSRERFRGWIRVRQCSDCGLRFKTVEMIAGDGPKPSRHDLAVNRIKEMAENMGIKLAED